MAPGSGSIVSPMWTSANGTTAYAASLYGTSFASPIVASYIGLIKSVRPSSTTDDIVALVDATAQKVSNMSGDVYTEKYGHGLIDANAGIQAGASLQTAESILTPKLAQTGSHKSEHSFVLTTSLSSGCTLDAGKYCTIWAQDEHGYDRFLPYSFSDSGGKAFWNWPGRVLGDGAWRIRARSGEVVSNSPYYLIMK